jgi:hypothetical protein
MSIRRWKVTEVRDNAKISSSLLIYTQPWLNIKCALGEGPYFNQERNQLRFVVSREISDWFICS